MYLYLMVLGALQLEGEYKYKEYKKKKMEKLPTNFK